MAGFLAVVYAIWRWILHPVDQAGKRLALPTQFTIVDFLCLFFLVQLPMAFIHYGDFGEAWGGRWLLDIFTWLACGSMWLVSVRTLSRAGVRKQWHRAVFLAFVLPVAVCSAIVVPCLTAVAVVMLLSNPPLDDLRWPVLALADAVLIAAVYVSGRFTRRIVDVPTAADPADEAGGSNDL
jgi:hypothetical protein